MFLLLILAFRAGLLPPFWYTCPTKNTGGQWHEKHSNDRKERIYGSRTYLRYTEHSIPPRMDEGGQHDGDPHDGMRPRGTRVGKKERQR